MTHVDEEVRSGRRYQVIGDAAQSVVLLVEGLVGRAEIAEQVFRRRLAEVDLDLAGGLRRRRKQLKLERGRLARGSELCASDISFLRKVSLKRWPAESRAALGRADVVLSSLRRTVIAAASIPPSSSLLGADSAASNRPVPSACVDDGCTITRFSAVPAEENATPAA